MSKAIIHVHQQKLKKNEPAIIVRDYKGSKHYSEVKINGPVRIVHSPTPDRCGARCWLEVDTKDIESAS